MGHADTEKIIHKKVTEAGKRAGLDEVYSLYNAQKDWWDIVVYYWDDDHIVRGESHMDSVIEDADEVIARCLMNAKTPPLKKKN